MLHSWYVLKTWQKYFAVCTTTWLTCGHGFMIIHSSSSEGIVQQGVYAVCTHSIWDPVWPRYTFKTCFIARPSLWQILPAITVAHILISRYYCTLSLFYYIGEALNIDPRQFYTQLYGVILELNTCKCILSCHSADKDWLCFHTCIYLPFVRLF